LIVKHGGNRPNPRSGIASTPLPNSNKAYFFGGVNDEVNSNDSDDDDDMRQGNFYSDLYLCTIDNEKATWQKIELSGIKEDTLDKKKRRGNAKDASSGPCENAGENDICDEDKTGEEGAIDEETTSRIQGLELDGDKTKVIGDGIDESKSSVRVVEDGAFTISSTIIHSNSEITTEQSSTVVSDMKSKGKINYPSPRFGAAMVLRQSILYLFGGMFEDEEDRQLTFNDFYSLDIRKLDTWQTLIESDIKTMEWFESEDEEEDDDDESDKRSLTIWTLTELFHGSCRR